MSLVSDHVKGAGSNPSQKVYVQEHVDYIKSLDTVRVSIKMEENGWRRIVDRRSQKRDELEFWLTEHLRINGVYWGLTALHLLGHPEALPRDETIDFVLACQHDNGGFAAAPGHDPHLLCTVYAVQILVTLDATHELEDRGRGGKKKVATCMFLFSFLFSFLRIVC